MNNYTTGAFVSLAIMSMGVIALILGISTFNYNRKSAGSHPMLGIFVNVFLWDFGYAWMGMCHGDDFAYVSRAIALVGVFLFMFFAVEYQRIISKYPIRKLIPGYVIYFIAAVGSWSQIIKKSTVTFEETAWGYWYRSGMSIARLIQFIAVMYFLGLFYFILIYFKRNTFLNREKRMAERLVWFGPILFSGYILDTLIPMAFGTAAIPGSAICAFASSILIYCITKKYKAFGISVRSVGENVFKEVNVPVFVMNRYGKIALCNEMSTIYFKRSAQEMQGLTLEDLIEEADDDDDDESLKKISDGKVYRVKRISTTYCSPDSTSIYDEFNDLLYSITFIQDVTESWNALKNMNESRELAEQANISKSVFLANISHEIRTPMNAIMGMSDILLQDKKLDSDQMQKLYDIKDAGEGLLGIINDVLDISKIEMGKYELIDDVFSFPDLINSVSSIIKVRLSESAVQYRLAVDPGMPQYVIGDEKHIRQIFINILGNAAKFTSKGSVTFSLTGENTEGCYRIKADVSDTGMGIREEDIEEIFGAFNQADTRKNRNIQGTGLGLSISRSLARLMDGDITVSSVYGKGSVFTITMLVKISGNDCIGEDTAKALMTNTYMVKEKETGFKYRERPDKHILIVDDNKVNLMVAKGLMTPYKMNVDLASSGKEAIEMIKNNDYDIVFMDHMMPEMDGVDTTKAIRAMEEDKYQNLIIIALTANAISGTREQLISAGMQDYLAKPIDKNELNDIIECWL